MINNVTHVTAPFLLGASLPIRRDRRGRHTCRVAHAMRGAEIQDSEGPEAAVRRGECPSMLAAEGRPGEMKRVGALSRVSPFTLFCFAGFSPRRPIRVTVDVPCVTAR